MKDNLFNILLLPVVAVVLMIFIAKCAIDICKDLKKFKV